MGGDLVIDAVEQVLPLALYDEMCRAIDAAYRVDEVKDIRDKARAFEVYARQAKNVEAESRACEIRLRAERKAGQLRTAMDKQAGARGVGKKVDCTDSSPPTNADLGLTDRQSSDWQKLGAISDDQFEAALADPDRRPTTAGIIASATPPKPEVIPVSKEALWLWGRLCEFERRGLLKVEPADVLLTMTPEMLDDTHELAPLIGSWLRRLGRD